MKSITIAEFKRQLPALLDQVARGENIVLQKGRKRENVAILTPYRETATKDRPLGLLARRGRPVFRDWDITEESFLDSK